MAVALVEGIYKEVEVGEGKPTIVCLCGSTRFWATFQEASLQETLAGKIVLSVGAATASDDVHFGHLPPDEVRSIKERLDELHLRKIDLADEVLILNQDGYLGESTRRELVYAVIHHKRVRFLVPPSNETTARTILEESEKLGSCLLCGFTPSGRYVTQYQDGTRAPIVHLPNCLVLPSSADRARQLKQLEEIVPSENQPAI